MPFQNSYIGIGFLTASVGCGIHRTYYTAQIRIARCMRLRWRKRGGLDAHLTFDSAMYASAVSALGLRGAGCVEDFAHKVFNVLSSASFRLVDYIFVFGYAGEGGEERLRMEVECYFGVGGLPGVECGDVDVEIWERL